MVPVTSITRGYCDKPRCKKAVVPCRLDRGRSSSSKVVPSSMLRRMNARTRGAWERAAAALAGGSLFGAPPAATGGSKQEGDGEKR